MGLAPAVATRRALDGSETNVPVEQLVPEDVVSLKPGERIPTDGEIVEGASNLDESMLTGESLPVEKAAGAKVFAGTTNLNGRLVVRVTNTGEETVLAQVIAAVERAQSSRANIQRLADRVSSIFVPIVIAIAIGAAWITARSRSFTSRVSASSCLRCVMSRITPTSPATAPE